MSTPNMARLLQLIGHLELYPESHDQGLWLQLRPDDEYDEYEYREGKAALEDITPSCGTTGCFAGWASVYFGPVGSIYYSDSSEGTHLYVPAEDGDFFFKRGKPRYIEYAGLSGARNRYRQRAISMIAEEALGLNSGQSAWLFEGHRSVQELKEGVKHILQRPNCAYSDLERTCREERDLDLRY